MSTEDNKSIVRHFYEEFNQKNLAVIDEFIDPHFVDHSPPPGVPADIEGAKQQFGIFQAFPDLQLTVEDLIAEGDKVVARLTIQGTHQGTFMGLPPTGKHVMFTAIDINRIAGGKSVEHWNTSDILGLLQQLGVVPSMG
jgi:predicted ester cyclase